MSQAALPNLNSDYWQNRYIQNQTGWDIGQPSTPLKIYADQLTSKNIAILIPGCGNAYEAEYLFRQGFTKVFVADVAWQPLLDFKKRVAGFPESQLLHQDFFTLTGQYDLILEQTFFCALDPELRPAYANQMHNLLKPGGKLAGVLFDTTFENKTEPPFGGNRDEYKKYFEPYFNFLHFETCYNSIPPRQGRELFMELEKK